MLMKEEFNPLHNILSLAKYRKNCYCKNICFYISSQAHFFTSNFNKQTDQKKKLKLSWLNSKNGNKIEIFRKSEWQNGIIPFCVSRNYLCNFDSKNEMASRYGWSKCAIAIVQWNIHLFLVKKIFHCYCLMKVLKNKCVD